LLGGCERSLLLGVCRPEPDSPARLLAAQQWEAPGRMADLLAPAMKQMLELLQLAPSELGGVACLRGPGSFTGLRIVLAFAEGFRLPWGLPAAGLSHLEALVRSAAPLLTERSVVLTHARTRQVYAQPFINQTASAEPEALDLDQARRLVLEKAPADTTALGSGLRRNPSLAQNLERAGVRLLDARFDEPSPQAVAEMAAAAEFRDDPVAPMYLRPSDAEENLERIAAARGVSVEQARRSLSPPGGRDG
jgi:tRNA threonylcarbamoyl adenosine modification protein YeaZ